MCDLKRCSGCKESKDKIYFSKNKLKKDGLNIYCKSCNRIQDKVKKDRLKIVPVTKVCGRCNLEKQSSDFPLNNLSKDGLYLYCKKCKRDLYYKESPKPVTIFLEKSTRVCMKCRVEKPFDEFFKSINRPGGIEFRCKMCKKEYQLENKESIKEVKDKWIKDNAERVRENRRLYFLKNKEKYKKYYKDNIDHIRVSGRKSRREYHKSRSDSDPLFKLGGRLRSLVRLTINNFKDSKVVKSKSTCDIVCCSLEDFSAHIESQFLPWMNWDNYGKYNGELNYGWDLDHIVPISHASTEGELLELNHWSNYQPLCSKTNRYIKKDSLYPVTNIVLNKTFWKQDKV